jgi:hypothetical protein
MFVCLDLRTCSPDGGRVQGKGLFELVDFVYGSQFQALFDAFSQTVCNFVQVGDYRRFWINGVTGTLGEIVVRCFCSRFPVTSVPRIPSFSPSLCRLFACEGMKRLSACTREDFLPLDQPSPYRVDNLPSHILQRKYFRELRWGYAGRAAGPIVASGVARPVQQGAHRPDDAGPRPRGRLLHQRHFERRVLSLDHYSSSTTILLLLLLLLHNRVSSHGRQSFVSRTPCSSQGEEDQ